MPTLPDNIERWKPVVGYEGLYEVSDFGRVRNILNRFGNPRSYILKQRRHTRGYMRVHLAKDGIINDHFIHKLVMAAFVGPCPDGFEVNHDDAAKANNRLSNLAYVTHKENVAHSVANGLPPVGSKHKNAKLDEDKVRQIRVLSATLGPYQIAVRFGVTHSIIKRILDGEGWKHVA